MTKIQNSKLYDLEDRTLNFAKEAKECRYWLKIAQPIEQLCSQRDELIQEATELMKIFGSILEKSQ